MSPQKPFIIGTRRSRLALWQTAHVMQLLRSASPHVHFETLPFDTQGDRAIDIPLPQIGGKGLFTAELEHALRSGAIDLAVHSLKDLPTTNAAGVVIGAISSRADVRDVLISANNATLEQLPPGARIGTSSVRRRAQLLAYRADLQIDSIRGNVDTRIQKVMDGYYDAAILAAAGVTRLNLDAHISQWLPLDLMLPAPGQAALAIQCRDNDMQTLQLLSAIDDAALRHAVQAERQFLAELEGGCSAPIGAYAYYDQPHQLHMHALVAADDGQTMIRVSGVGSDGVELGRTLAAEALQKGAASLLQ